MIPYPGPVRWTSGTRGHSYWRTLTALIAHPFLTPHSPQAPILTIPHYLSLNHHPQQPLLSAVCFCLSPERYTQIVRVMLPYELDQLSIKKPPVASLSY